MDNLQPISSPADDNHSCIYTVEEIKKYGLRVRPDYFQDHKELPEPVHCEFCGRTLHYEGVLFGNVIVSIHNTPQRCTCEKAVEHWKAVDEAIEEQKRQEELAEQERKWQLRLERSKISKRHLACRLNNYKCTTDQQKLAKDTAANYIRNFADMKAEGRGLYIEGTCGTGKTHIATAISIELLRQGYSVIMQTPHSLLADIKKAYNEYPEYTEDEIVARYKKVSLLVIDDLGKKPASNWDMGMLYDILDYRYGAMLPTIITTNYNETDLCKRLTPTDGDSQNIISIVSRLRATTDVITMAWDDYRGGANG